eukprot:2437802-Amphidinium_carterae.1
MGKRESVRLFFLAIKLRTVVQAEPAKVPTCEPFLPPVARFVTSVWQLLCGVQEGSCLMLQSAHQSQALKMFTLNGVIAMEA